MSATLYDDAVVKKLQAMIPSETGLKILKPDETERFLMMRADESRDSITLPQIMLSRRGYRILNTNKQPKSWDGIKIRVYDKDGDLVNQGSVLKLNAIPIYLEYQLDIYTINLEECEDYVREFIFELVNNPRCNVVIPYNNSKVTHNFSIHVQENVEDNSDIKERLFPGQFTRYTLTLTIDDAYLFSVPNRKNVEIVCAGISIVDEQSHEEIEKIKVFSKN